MPGMLDAYDDLYTAIAFEPHSLTRHDHEFVWLAILITMHEVLGTHHIKRFHDAGGTDAELADVLSIAALAGGGHLYRFVDRSLAAPACRGWNPARLTWKPSPEHRATRPWHWLTLPVPPYTPARPIGRCWNGKSAPATRRVSMNVTLAEALSLMMFPGSVPNFVEAAAIWRELILGGRVDASPAFRAWAEVSGQGGYDEAAGIKPEDQ